MKINLIAILLLALTSCVQTSGKKEPENKEITEKLPPKIKGWRTLDTKGYSIQYPATWKVNNFGRFGRILVSHSDSETDKFREDVKLVVRYLPEGTFDLDSYAKSDEKQLKEIIGVTTFIENKRQKNINGDYQKLVYSEEPVCCQLVNIKYSWVINKQVFVLIFTSEKDKYEANKKVGEQILNSFVLK